MRPPEILTSAIESTSAASASSNNMNIPKQSSKSQIHSLNSHISSSNNTTMASNMTTSHTTATSPNNKNNNNGTDMSPVMPAKTATSNFITNSNNNKHEMQYNANNYQQHFHMQQPQHHVKRRNIQKEQLQQHIINHKLNDNNDNKSNISSSSSNNNNHGKINDIHYKTFLIHHKNQPQHLYPTTITQALIFKDIMTLNLQTTSPRNPLRSTTTRLHSINATNKPAFGLNLHHKSTNKRQKRSDNSTETTIYADVVVNKQKPQSFNFISTANNENSFYAKNPVITKLLKRSKRKEFEFRKRRRIRPCLSVCQTVEQKCPYLLPADRAPSMPTQYAGEPTFLCLDYNIAETAEQLSKASHGPNECCYTYCSSSANGICTYCNDMWDKTETDKEAEVLSVERETKVLNIKLKPKDRVESESTIRVETRIQQKMGEETNDLKMSTVAIEVRNDTAFENATRLAERLQYYAFCNGVFYYDDGADDMPKYPNSENCRALPPVQSRCSIPYYATNYISSADMLGSYRKNKEAQKLLIWLSTLLCLWSCYSARSLRVRRYNDDKRQQNTAQQQLTHQKQHKTTNTAYREGNMCQSCQTREIMQNVGNCKKVIKLWYDDKECRIIIIYWLRIGKGTATTTATKTQTAQHKKCLKVKYLLVRNLRQILHSTSVQVNLKILEIPSLILLINYKEMLLLLFKKIQKLRKRKIKNSPSTARITTTKTDGKCWTISRDLRWLNMKSKAKKFSFKYKIHYYYYDYYCSCRQIFSCSSNKNIINNYYNSNKNNKYIKRFKYNFSTCNLNKNNTNYNNKKKQMKMKINYKKVSIIKFNTTTTTTHIFIINTYNNNNNNISSSSNHKTNYYNIITIIIISYNVCNTNNSNRNTNTNNSNKQQKIFNSFSSITNNQHQHYHHYCYYYCCCCNNYNYPSLKFKPYNNTNKLINNNNKTVLLKTLRQILMTDLILKIMTTITTTMLMIMLTLMRVLKMLLFKSFLKIKYNNNHHMKNIKSNFSFSPNTSYNSDKTNYRYFYCFNFNINDWWQRRRWWRRRRGTSSHPLLDHHYATQSLLMIGVSSQGNFCQHILL